MAAPSPGGADRSRELADSLAAMHDRLAAAARTAGRSADDLTLISVTKTWPATDVATMFALGVRDVGENRDQEAAAKVAAVASLLGAAPAADLRWHFIGQVQRNKARSVASYAAMVHSVDRPALVDALGRAASAVGRVLPVCVQVDLTKRPGSRVARPVRPAGAAPPRPTCPSSPTASRRRAACAWRG